MSIVQPTQCQQKSYRKWSKQKNAIDRTEQNELSLVHVKQTHSLTQCVTIWIEEMDVNFIILLCFAWSRLWICCWHCHSHWRWHCMQKKFEKIFEIHFSSCKHAHRTHAHTHTTIKEPCVQWAVFASIVDRYVLLPQCGSIDALSNTDEVSAQIGKCFFFRLIQSNRICIR